MCEQDCKHRLYGRLLHPTALGFFSHDKLTLTFVHNTEMTGMLACANLNGDFYKSGICPAGVGGKEHTETSHC